MKCVAVLVFVLCASVVEAAPVRLMVDGVPFRTAPRPVIRHGRIFLPAAAFRKIGLGVDEDRSGIKEVFWPSSDVSFDFKAGRKWVSGQMMGSRVSISAAPFYKHGALMVPLRDVTGNMFPVDWQPQTRTANILRPKHWLKWRMDEDNAMRRERSRWYETPITGNLD